MKMGRRKWLVAIIIVVLALEIGNVWALSDKEHLVGKEYVAAVRELVGNAKEKIEIYMYFFIADTEGDANPVNSLLEELVAALKRGVKVLVRLEGRKMAANGVAYRTLKKYGADVKFDSPKEILHSKDVIVDGRYCITGSTNWSRAAIMDNRETGVYLDSFDFAQKVREYYAGLEVMDEAVFLPRDGVAVPEEFLFEPQYGARLFKEHAQKAFDLYLVLLRKSKGGEINPLQFSYEEIALSLGYPETRAGLEPAPTRTQQTRAGNKDESYYLKIRKPFQTLKRCGLIKYGTLRQREVELVLSSKKSFLVPEGYWDYDFCKRLSFRAKYMYLICLLEAQRSDEGSWGKSNLRLADIYHISTDPVSKGLWELERENLVEITRSQIAPGEYAGRDVNMYGLNRLASEEEFAKWIAEMQKEYGRKITGNAQFLAGQLNEPLDMQKIEMFIHLIRKYGYLQVLEANGIAVKRKRGTAGFSIETTIRALEAE